NRIQEEPRDGFLVLHPPVVYLVCPFLEPAVPLFELRNVWDRLCNRDDRFLEEASVRLPPSSRLYRNRRTPRSSRWPAACGWRTGARLNTRRSEEVARAPPGPTR